MFNFSKKGNKTYKEKEFSFEYPRYMKMRLEGEMTVCFFNKKWPTGVLRMSRIMLDENPPSSKQLLEETKATFEEEGIKNQKEIDINGMKGVEYFDMKTFNVVDDYYWPGGQVAKYQNKLSKDNELEWAMGVSNLMRMTMRYYQFGNERIHFYFSYRHFFNQSEKTQLALDDELKRVEEILKSIKFE